MSQSPKKLIRSREYRLHTYTNCFVGSEFVDFVIEKGEVKVLNNQLIDVDEVRSRPAAVALGRRLLKVRHLSRGVSFLHSCVAWDHPARGK